MPISIRPRSFVEIYKNAANKGLLLLIICIAGIIISSTSYSILYIQLCETKIFNMSLTHLTSDILMSTFFLLVGIEIKKEMITGNLQTKKQRLLPVTAAIAGVIFPIIIYSFFNYDDPIKMRGWAIPAATDIAFALAILSIVGKNINPVLRIFLTALAIIDDLIAVLIIAIVYTTQFNILFSALSLLIVALLLILNTKQNSQPTAYLIIGALLCFCLYMSGIHSSISGVILALFIPMQIITRIEKLIAPFVSYLVLPLFVLTNCAIELPELKALSNPVSLGVILGLFLGKPIGISLCFFTMKRLKLIEDVSSIDTLQFISVAMLCGVGFTMSLFISNLAFDENLALLQYAKLGTFIGSMFASFFGALICKISVRRKKMCPR